MAPTFELSIQIYKVCLKLIGKKKPLGGLRIGILAKLLLAKKKNKEEIVPVKLFDDLGESGCLNLYIKLIFNFANELQ